MALFVPAKVQYPPVPPQKQFIVIAGLFARKPETAGVMSTSTLSRQ
jgi:hypothetical protein